MGPYRICSRLVRVQYRGIRYTQRLAEAEVVASVGSRGDYNNALAEAYNSLFKVELIRNKGPWRGIDDLEVAAAEYSTGQSPASSWRDRHDPTRRTAHAAQDFQPKMAGTR